MTHLQVIVEYIDHIRLIFNAAILTITENITCKYV